MTGFPFFIIVKGIITLNIAAVNKDVSIQRPKVKVRKKVMLREHPHAEVRQSPLVRSINQFEL